jgi:transposase-like protein
MRGKKGVRHGAPGDPPRRRGNKVKGHGTWTNDRLPVLGVVGRQSGQIRLEAVRSSARAWLEPRVLKATSPGSWLYTDEWPAYHHLTEHDRRHSAVDHNPRHPEWARDDDGDGIREVHCNTMEGIWTGLRNFLRPFRGVSKIYLAAYVAVFQWAHNIRRVTDQYLAILLGGQPTTDSGP